MMYYLKCSNCGKMNEVTTEYLVFCPACSKKLEPNFSSWKKSHPNGSFEEFKTTACLTENAVVSAPVAPKTGRRIPKYLIGVISGFIILSALGAYFNEDIIALFRKPLFDKELMMFASELNKNCPIMVDAETRLDNALALPNNVFQYNYTLVNQDQANIDTSGIKAMLGPSIVNTVKTNPEMSYFRDNKVTVNYSYKDRSGMYLFLISVTPEMYAAEGI